MIEQIDFMEIKDKCPIGYDRFKKFLMKYEFGNFCYTILDTHERHGAIKLDHQISMFFGWLDKFFIENDIVVNIQLVYNSRVDIHQVEHAAEVMHYPEVTDLIRNSSWGWEESDRITAWRLGFTEAFLMLEERL